MPALDWLTARPIAHRGLHDAAAGTIENTPSAFTAAIIGNYAIECDIQITADGEAMVHHDDVLGRLTEGSGRLDGMMMADLKQVRYKTTADRMMTLGELSDLVCARVVLVVELKSRFDGDLRLPKRAAAVLSGYAGPAAVISFDPAQIAALRATAPKLPRGIVAESRHGDRDWRGLPARKTTAFGYFRHVLRARPQFMAYSIRDLPAPVPLIARRVLGLPLLTWTVRTHADRKRAARWADQIIFEGFRP